MPFVQAGTVKEHLEALGLFFVGKLGERSRFQLGEDLVNLVHGIAVIGTTALAEEDAGFAQQGLKVFVVNFFRGLGSDPSDGIGRLGAGAQVRIIQITAGQLEGLHGRQLRKGQEDLLGYGRFRGQFQGLGVADPLADRVVFIGLYQFRITGNRLLAPCRNGFRLLQQRLGSLVVLYC